VIYCILQGTDIYDAKKGMFVDLGILDIQQIFGRAGRPQFDEYGHGTIITTYDKLSHYLSLLTQQNPIESQFEVGLTDNLNAEVKDSTFYVCLWLPKAFEQRFLNQTNIFDKSSLMEIYYLKLFVLNYSVSKHVLNSKVIDFIQTASICLAYFEVCLTWETTVILATLPIQIANMISCDV